MTDLTVAVLTAAILALPALANPPGVTFGVAITPCDAGIADITQLFFRATAIRAAAGHAQQILADLVAGAVAVLSTASDAQLLGIADLARLTIIIAAATSSTGAIETNLMIRALAIPSAGTLAIHARQVAAISTANAAVVGIGLTHFVHLAVAVIVQAIAGRLFARRIAATIEHRCSRIGRCLTRWTRGTTNLVAVRAHPKLLRTASKHQVIHYTVTVVVEVIADLGRWSQLPITETEEPLHATAHPLRANPHVSANLLGTGAARLHTFLTTTGAIRRTRHRCRPATTTGLTPLVAGRQQGADTLGIANDAFVRAGGAYRPRVRVAPGRFIAA